MAESGIGANAEKVAAEFRVADPELFAKNMARAVEHAAEAASAYMEPRQSGENKASFAVDFGEITKTLTQVAEAWLAKPDRAIDAQAELWRGYLDLWAFSMRRMAGLPAEPVAEPEPKDWRFADPGWREHHAFDVIKQAYLVTARWAERMVVEAEGLDDHTRHKAEFFMRQIVNAAAPSNFVPTNPELLRETVASNGANLVRGMQYLAEDIRRGRGDLKIRQTDPSRFEVGVNLATAPGKVVFQNELMQLIQYAPTTEMVARRPLVIVPPWINKFYILDLAPEKSMIRWLVDQGHTVFVISWVNPDERLADKSFEDYMREGVFAALDAASAATGERQANMVGYCVGGTLLSVSLAHMASSGDDRVASASFLAAQADFTHAGDLKVFIDEPQLVTLEERMRERGYLEGREMAEAFNLMRSNDLIWPYVVGTYLKGKDPLPFDLLYWNSDATRMPAANHAFYLRRCYLNNDLSQGRMAFGNVQLDLKKVTLPIYSLATREDHIAPAKSVFLSASFYGSPVRFVLGGSGHIAGVVNHPKRGKYPHWVGGPPEGDLEEWIARAEERPGSWWPDWQTWLDQRNGEERVPAREPGGGKLKVIEDAPGSYVRVKD